MAGQDVTNLTKVIEYNETKIIIDLSRLHSGTYHVKTKSNTKKIYKQ